MSSRLASLQHQSSLWLRVPIIAIALCSVFAFTWRAHSQSSSAALLGQGEVRGNQLYLPLIVDPRESVLDLNSPIVSLIEIDPGDPNGNDDLGYAVISNPGRTAIQLTGWQLVNTSRSDDPGYTFPDFTIPPRSVGFVWATAGTDDAIAMDFYWNRTDHAWRSGDRVELRDATGNVVARFLVP